LPSISIFPTARRQGMVRGLTTFYAGAP